MGLTRHMWAKSKAPDSSGELAVVGRDRRDSEVGSDGEALPSDLLPKADLGELMGAGQKPSQASPASPSPNRRRHSDLASPRKAATLNLLPSFGEDFAVKPALQRQSKKLDDSGNRIQGDEEGERTSDSDRARADYGRRKSMTCLDLEADLPEEERQIFSPARKILHRKASVSPFSPDAFDSSGALGSFGLGVGFGVQSDSGDNAWAFQPNLWQSFASRMDGNPAEVPEPTAEEAETGCDTKGLPPSFCQFIFRAMAQKDWCWFWLAEDG